MNIIGSSSITQIGTYEYVVGLTGPTGPRGLTGIAGIGLTGGTGSSIVGISLVDRQILTTFDDGTTYLSPTKIYGATGGYKYLVDFKNNGEGVSIGYGITNDTLLLRPIRLVANNNWQAFINTTPSTVIAGLNPKTTTGLTLAGITANNNYFVKFKNNILRRIPIIWDPSANGVALPLANVFQKVRGMGFTGAGVTCISSSAGITCYLDPFAADNNSLMYGSTSKIFIGDFSGNTAGIVVAPCPSNNGIAYGFDVYINNAKNPTDLTKRFTSSSPIKWPKNETPCFSYLTKACEMKVSFFGIDGSWYATAKPLGISCSNTELFKSGCGAICSNCSTTAFRSSVISTTGACCKPDGTCVETLAANCDGFFHGYGTTCGTAYSSICDKPGACCIRPGYGSGIATCQQLTCRDCVGISLAYSRYAGNYTTCSSISCNDVLNDVGACCDGLGHCSEISFTDCVANNGFYQGNGSKCFDKNIAVCSTGTGPCCVNGFCNEISSSSCFAQNGYYLGRDRSCYDFTCPQSVSCIGYINGVPLSPGQNYGGGIVVGKYEPGISKIYGAKQWFDPTNIQPINGVTTYSSQEYKSYLDHTAYGITKDCEFLNESYIIIVYPKDLTTELNENTFAWGGTGAAWGPILDAGGNYSDLVLHYDQTDPSVSPIQYWKTHLKYGEGYWSVGVTQNAQTLLVNTFPTCSAANVYGTAGVERVFAKNPYALHGLWHQSWGLYNTIRAVNAINTNTKQVSLAGVFSWRDFAGTSLPNAFNYTRQINDGITSESQGITTNSGALSGWYIPSHDEFAFIAANTKNITGFNINNQLMLTPNAQPLNGSYWTSTGTFDYTKSEGIYDGVSKPAPGSVAFTMTFDINGVNYKVTKANRQTRHKVRPIRMIRCDAQIPQNRYLWLIPSVLSDTGKQINQRNIDTINIEAV